MPEIKLSITYFGDKLSEENIAVEIMAVLRKLDADCYVTVSVPTHYSADDLCPVCHKLRDENGMCDCYKSWGNTKTNSMKWIKASELPDPFPDIVVTMLDNGRVFAYDTTHSLKGLKEIIKHHPEMKCFCFNKAESPSESDAVEQEEMLYNLFNDMGYDMDEMPAMRDKIKSKYTITKK